MAGGGPRQGRLAGPLPAWAQTWFRPALHLRLCLSRSRFPAWPQDYVQALTGFCYDGVEGLIYLALFSFITALMFSSVVCSVPHTWQQKR